MSQTREDIPYVFTARVLWWNSSHIYVRCPHCHEIHQSKFSGYDTLLQRKIHHLILCNAQTTTHRYEICFPFSTTSDDIRYGINKRLGLYAADGEHPEAYFEKSSLPAPDSNTSTTSPEALIGSIENLTLSTKLCFASIRKRLDESKTVAILDRGPCLPQVWAASGYLHVSDGTIRELKGKGWMSQVKSFSNRYGYRLTSSVYDQRWGHGAYNACHAEKKLAAFLLKKHYFLPHEVDDELTAGGSEESKRIMALRQLKKSSHQKRYAVR
ncbi:hypothetical protein GGR57DRAFT_500811 [Xylariaceae sp. FL1272]|nr:hypothetical protein GGR57DRAFT_500811 [Xylariaceae sp. FL1272]